MQSKIIKYYKLHTLLWRSSVFASRFSISLAVAMAAMLQVSCMHHLGDGSPVGSSRETKKTFFVNGMECRLTASCEIGEAVKNAGDTVVPISFDFDINNSKCITSGGIYAIGASSEDAAGLISNRGGADPLPWLYLGVPQSREFSIVLRKWERSQAACRVVIVYYRDKKVFAKKYMEAVRQGLQLDEHADWVMSFNFNVRMD